MRHLFYNVRYFAVPNISSMLIVAYSSVKHSPLLNQHSFTTTQNIQLFHDIITEFDCTLLCCYNKLETIMTVDTILSLYTPTTLRRQLFMILRHSYVV